MSAARVKAWEAGDRVRVIGHTRDGIRTVARVGRFLNTSGRLDSDFYAVLDKSVAGMRMWNLTDLRKAK